MGLFGCSGGRGLHQRKGALPVIEEKTLDILRQDIKTYMRESRYRHTLGVEKEMRFLAAYYMPHRVTEAAAAGLLHDVTKEMTQEEQFAYCREFAIPLSEEEKLSPSLLHARTGAHFAKTHFPACTTAAVARAIERHTVAAKHMSIFDAMLYLADYTEENRRYPKCLSLRQKIHTALPAARPEDRRLLLSAFLLEAYDNTLSSLIEMGCVISPATLKARNFLLAKGVHYDK